MKIVAIAMARNEADIIEEGVREALRWVDDFVIYDHGSTDDTAGLAERAGAIVLLGDSALPFDESLRQYTLDAAGELDPDWVIRIDVDEIYHHTPDLRQTLEHAYAAGAFCVRAWQMEFWITFDDIRRGLLLEDERVSVQKRRRWYTSGHMAMVAWRHLPELRYYPGQRQNVPLDPQRRDVSRLGPCHSTCLVQRHYNCRSLRQLLLRMRERTDHQTFGKYRHNLIIDEQIGLHYLRPDEAFSFVDNHFVVYKWYEKSLAAFRERMKRVGE